MKESLHDEDNDNGLHGPREKKLEENTKNTKEEKKTSNIEMQFEHF